MHTVRTSLAPLLCVLLLVLTSCSKGYNYSPPAGTGGTAITHYSFGKMVIDGKEYRSDLIIQPGGRLTTWLFETETHKVIPEDLAREMNGNIEHLVIGLGFSGAAELSEEAKTYVEQLRADGIEVDMLPSTEAAELFNRSEKETLLAFFHLNC